MNPSDNMTPEVRAAFIHHTAIEVLETSPPEARPIFAPLVDQVLRFDWTAESAREFKAALDEMTSELDADLPTYLWVVFGAFIRGGYPQQATFNQILDELDMAKG